MAASYTTMERIGRRNRIGIILRKDLRVWLEVRKDV